MLAAGSDHTLLIVVAVVLAIGVLAFIVGRLR